MRYLKRTAMSAVAVVAFLAAATSASAAPATGYEAFADCPDRTVRPDLGPCVVSEVTSGHLQMGTKDTPIIDPIRLVGAAPVGTSNEFVVGEFDGGRQKVPGGLVGITGLEWLADIFPGDLLNIYAESELAGDIGNPLGVEFALPLKVRLVNPLLSNTCYIGSNANPIALNLTKAHTNPPPPNQPITGSAGTVGFDPVLGILTVTGIRLVDNEFAAPAAQGCDLVPVGVVDALVNLQAGLPSPAGTNETIQNGSAQAADITRIFPPDGID